MDYVIAVQAPAFPISDTSFATESAFAEHLKELRRSVGPRFRRVVLIAPRLPRGEYEAKKAHLGVVRADTDEVVFLPAHETTTTTRGFWFAHAWALWRRVSAAVREAGVVHSGLADDLRRPLMAFVNLAGWRHGRPVVFIVDIDFRQHTQRFHQLGIWGRKSYLVNRWVYDPLKWLQVWSAPKLFQLVLLKSASMVRDFGGGRPHVRNFYDTVHALGDVLDAEEQTRRLAWLDDGARPLQLIYFGRFVPYKGLDRAVEAVRLAREQGADVRLSLVGEGECRAALVEQVSAARLDSVVSFHPQLPYGQPLFAMLGQAHLSLATPLVEDTPRSVFDAMARGLPTLAFDISYFRDLAADSGAIALAAWPDAAQLAQRIVEIDRDRTRLANMAQRGLDFARHNTQIIWLERRARWIEEVVEDVATAPPRDEKQPS